MKLISFLFVSLSGCLFVSTIAADPATTDTITITLQLNQEQLDALTAFTREWNGPNGTSTVQDRIIADAISMHESTVSRVTSNKYIATPRGIFELKYFFSRSMPTQSGGTCSATAIRGLIKDMIEAEDGAHPLSDAEIALRVDRRHVGVDTNSHL